MLLALTYYEATLVGCVGMYKLLMANREFASRGNETPTLFYFTFLCLIDEACSVYMKLL